MQFSYFFRSGRPNRKKAVKMTSQSPSGTLQAGPREAEIDQLFAPRGPKEASIEFFFGPRAVPGPPPRAIWGAPGGHPGPTWRPEVPRSPPGLHFGPSGPPPGSISRSFAEMSCLLFSRVHVAFCCAFSRACSSAFFVLGASTLQF